MKTLLTVFAIFLTGLMAVGQVTVNDNLVLQDEVKLRGVGNGILLSWNTIKEKNVSSYVVVKKINGQQHLIANLPAKSTIDSIHHYRFTDATRITKGVAYKIRCIFTNEEIAETNWIEATKAHTQHTRILSALDEDSISRLNLKVEVDHTQEVTLSIQTLEGETLDQYQKTLTTGINQIAINYGDWPSGFYAVNLSDSSSKKQWIVHVDDDEAIIQKP